MIKLFWWKISWRKVCWESIYIYQDCFKKYFEDAG